MSLFWYELGALSDLRTAVCKSRDLEYYSLKILNILCVQFTRWDGTTHLVGINMSRGDCLSTRVNYCRVRSRMICTGHLLL